MARALVIDRSEVAAETHERVIEEYRERLNRKADVPSSEYTPVIIGPTWEITDNGYWRLPERTIGWDVLGWCGTWLQHGQERPWRFTDEQARFVLWWYALDAAGGFLYRDGVLQRLKGWGKDPLGACLSATELLGPCRFEEFWHGDEAVAKDNPNAWVQTVAVSLEQTKNTMRLFPSLFSPAAYERFELQIGKEQIYALGGSRFLQAHTSSPHTMEGNRVTFMLMNETWRWYGSNDGHDMWNTIRGNLAKAPDGGSRSLAITNAYIPGEDSVAERRRETWERMQSGQVLTTGVLYDSLEAPPEAPLTADAAPLVVPGIRGDSIWLHSSSIVADILDADTPPSESRRKWYNQITATEDSWVTPQQWDTCEDKTLKLEDGDQIVEFFDGSKSNDSTGLVACRISDGAVFFRGCWQRPANHPGWTVPRDEVDSLVRRDFECYDVVAFFGDPGLGEDESGQRYWDAYLDSWGRDFGGDGPSSQGLCIWATDSGLGRHATLWDMRSPARLKQFTEACERVQSDIQERAFVHNGNGIMRDHARNARRRPNNYGVSVGKESKMSSKKIDTLVCAIGAKMLQRHYLALPESKKRQGDRGPQIWL